MLTLICGVGRVGKTTYSQRFENVIHLDGMGHKPHRFTRVINALNKGDVVVEGIYENANRRTELLNAYKGCGRRCIWLDTPESIVKDRMEIIGVPLTVKHFHFEPPTFDEGWDEIIIIRGEHDVQSYRNEKQT